MPAIDPCPHRDCDQPVTGLRQNGDKYRLRPCGHYVALVAFTGRGVQLAEPVDVYGRPIDHGGEG
jgi:hypothetical protein